MRWLALLVVCALAGCMDDGGNATAGPSQDPTPTQDEPEPTTQAPTPEPEPENETQPRDPVTWTISITDNDFVDGSITIQVGDTVRWEHDGNAPHTVTSSQGDELDSGTMTPVAASTYSHTFDTVGEYPYFCEVHPSMTDKITVLEVYLEEP